MTTADDRTLDDDDGYADCMDCGANRAGLLWSDPCRECGSHRRIVNVTATLNIEMSAVVSAIDIGAESPWV